MLLIDNITQTTTTIATMIITLTTALTSLHTLGQRLGLWRWFRTLPRMIRAYYCKRQRRRAVQRRNEAQHRPRAERRA